MVKKDLTSWFIGIALLFIVFDYFGWLFPFKKLTELLIIPTKRSVHEANVLLRNLGSVVTQYSYIEKTFSDRLKLAKINEELAAQIRNLTEENFKLRKQLEAPLPATFKFIPAAVLGISRFMEIGAGSEDGVKAGMTVVDSMVLLGKVTAVSSHRSSVMLLTDSDMQVSAKTSRGTKGLVSGSLGQNIMMDKILQKEPLFIDDQVETDGADGFPKNLLIGKVVYIKSEDVAVFKQAKIEVPVDYKKETNVFVISL